MITEDQLEQLAIQWFQDTGGENIEHRTPNIERRSEEKWSLAGAGRISGSRQISRQSVARGVVEVHDMNRDMVSRFGGESGGKLGIATKIATGRFQRRSFPEEARATIRRNRRVQIERKRDP